MTEPQIVSAVMTIAYSEVPGLGDAIEEAMTDAVVQALEAGVSITDTAEILRWKQQAYDAVVEAFR